MCAPPDETRAVADEFRTILDRIAERELRVNLAVKLTHLGLLIDEELAFENVAAIVDHAESLGNFVRIDMEQSNLVDATLRIYGRLRDSGRDAVGCVLQSYLYRTPADLEALLPVTPNLRLVKGAYLEPAEIAFPQKRDVDAAYVRLLERALLGGAYLAVATHDERLIAHTIRFTEQHGIGRDRYEFQMLYGVRPQLQLDLAGRGYNVLVATPYGPEWYPYLMRRLAERPANVLFIVRNLHEVKDPAARSSTPARSPARWPTAGARRRRRRRLCGPRRRELPLVRAGRRGSARLRHGRRSRPESVAGRHARRGVRRPPQRVRHRRRAPRSGPRLRRRADPHA